MKVLRLFKIAFLVVFGIALAVVGLANLEPVTLKLLPGGLAEAVGITNEVTLPLVAVILAAVVLGIIVGFFLEWLREHHHRVEAKVQRRKATRLSDEMAAMTGRRGDSQEDDILALVDDASAAR